MIEWYKDDELKICFDNKPLVKMRYALPSDTKKTKENIKKYPFINLKELYVEITYKENIYRFTIPKGYKWDGATIPRLLWRLIGSKTQPEFLIPSLIHDVLCENHSYIDNNRNLSSKIFKSLLLVSGVPKLKAQIMYISVDNFQRFCGW